MQTRGGDFKELTVYKMAKDIVRLVMAEAVRRQEVAVDRISFVIHAALCERVPGLFENHAWSARFEQSKYNETNPF